MKHPPPPPPLLTPSPLALTNSTHSDPQYQTTPLYSGFSNSANMASITSATTTESTAIDHSRNSPYLSQLYDEYVRANRLQSHTRRTIESYENMSNANADLCDPESTLVRSKAYASIQSAIHSLME